MMAEALVIFQKRDIRGAILPEKVVDQNSVAALRLYIQCRGLKIPRIEQSWLVLLTSPPS